jgi:hypothetical protein
MNDKTVKATGNLKYAGVFIPAMIKYIGQKDGINVGYAKNHHTVSFRLENGEVWTCHAYETKTMIIIDWAKAL